MEKTGLLLLFIFSLLQSFAQTCDGPGQKPSKAFPVCGNSVFHQTSVPLCAGRKLPSPSCNRDPIADVNPFWYKFTCFEAGTLGFTITPSNLSDDYDWELYDVTNRNPDDIYTDGKMVVSSNWSGEGGKTGAGSTGRSLFVCAGPGQDLYSKMATLQKGHDYLLLISHFTQSQSGYDLEFKGGTAVITDTLSPRLKLAEAACSGDIIRLKLNKKMRCNSLATDGSDFYVAIPGNTVISAKGFGCDGGFDTDSVELRLSKPLGPGTYQLMSKKGADGNTILDICGNAVPDNDMVSFTVYPFFPTPMDSLAPVSCAPKTLRLVFRKPMLCNSIASNGSDFSITGSYPVQVISASGNCSASGLSKEIIITLAQPLQQKGNFVITLRQGTDGNTVLDECAKETPAGSTLTFSVKDTVNADFSYELLYGCEADTVNYFHNGANEVNSWRWNLDDNKTSRLQNPQGIYTVFEKKQITLIVNNGFCADTTTKVVHLDNFLKADFTVSPDNCPSELIPFTSTAVGKIAAHNWSFGDGGISNEQDAKHTYAQPSRETAFNVRYTVTDSLGCTKTTTKPISIYSSCTIFIPNAFTPNNDGSNDVFRALNAVKADSYNLRIYNRWGQLVFTSKNWKQGWDGTIKGQPQGSGTYIWHLQYIDRRNNEKIQRKGTVLLIR